MPACATISGLVPAPRRDLCLEFANTRYWRGRPAPTEALSSFGALVEWCAASGALDGAMAQALAAGCGDRGGEVYAGAIALREAIWRIFADCTAGAAPAVADVDRLDRALSKAPVRRSIEPSGGGFAWRAEAVPAAVPGLLAPVLWSAADLLLGPELGRVRSCANAECRWLFIDDSQAGTRRWCSMSACGNRAKAHRHYRRRRAAESVSG